MQSTRVIPEVCSTAQPPQESKLYDEGMSRGT